MKILVSVSSGYNAREILLPCRERLETDNEISTVFVLTPAASARTKLFPTFKQKFDFRANPSSVDGHARLLKTLKPTVVVTPTIGLDPKDTLVLKAAKKLGIPTLTFVASWDNVFKMERLFKHGHAGPTKQFGKEYALPDHLAVWNKMNSDHLQKILPGYDETNITITGPPRFDYFAHPNRVPSKQELFTYLGIKKPADDTDLIHCATTELYPFEYVIKQIHDFAANRENIHIHASVHPGGDISKHRQYTKYGVSVRYSFGRRGSASRPDFAYLPKDEETYMLVALFKRASVLISQSSTVAIESMRADVPVINIKYGRRFDWWRWRRSMPYRDFKQHYRYITDNNATVVVDKRGQLIHELRASLSYPEQRRLERAKTVQKLITYSDGSCGQRLLAAVKKLA